MLLGLAEVSIAITGFSGVVGAVSGKTWGGAERFRFINLTSFAIAATLFSFLPLAVFSYNVSEAFSWAMSASLLTMFVVVFQTNGFFRVRKLRGGEASIWAKWFLVTGSAIVAVLQLIGLTVPSIINATYITGILILILLAVFQFVVFVIRIFVRHD